MTRRRRRLLGLLVVAAVGLSGCSVVHANTMPDPDTWIGTLSAAQVRAGTGHFESADTVLATYASLHPGSREALESTYWRALFRMDPNNPRTSLTNGLALLDGYLADNRPRDHVIEALSIRRIVAQLDGLNKLAANALAQARDANATARDARAQAADARSDAAKVSDSPASAEEVKKLREELAKANAELERIRKRLATPPLSKPDR